MGALLSVLLSFLSQILQKEYLIQFFKWLAWKVVIVTLMFSGSWILYTIIVGRVFDMSMSIIQAKIAAGDTGGLITVTGFAGWIFSCLRLPEFFSVMFSAISVKVALRMLPFSPVK